MKSFEERDMPHSEYADWLVDKAVAKATLRILELDTAVQELSEEMGEVKAVFRRKKPKAVEPPSFRELVKRAEKKFSDAGLVRGTVRVGGPEVDGGTLYWDGACRICWSRRGFWPRDLADSPDLAAVVAMPALFEKLVKDTAEHRVRVAGAKASLEEFLDE